MPDKKNDNGIPLDQNATETKKRMEALVRAIRDEMDSLTPEELEKLYAAIALMEMEKDK